MKVQENEIEISERSCGRHREDEDMVRALKKLFVQSYLCKARPASYMWTQLTSQKVRASWAINILVLKNGSWKDGRSRDAVQNRLMCVVGGMARINFTSTSAQKRSACPPSQRIKAKKMENLACPETCVSHHWLQQLPWRTGEQTRPRGYKPHGAAVAVKGGPSLSLRLSPISPSSSTLTSSKSIWNGGEQNFGSGRKLRNMFLPVPLSTDEEADAPRRELFLLPAG
ncbi:uncharacterized protein LOC123946194 isoform X2 [Meles meles]|uniref:uncharacterized protein LOC123946194 isoform X2 n=1 Tax=Meles meles TaxID=9662 RepID=UPI001E6A0880|nr:uncharacterized protein LOC123946194 isoform X2 [Meles meles]